MEDDDIQTDKHKRCLRREGRKEERKEGRKEGREEGREGGREGGRKEDKNKKNMALPAGVSMGIKSVLK